MAAYRPIAVGLVAAFLVLVPATSISQQDQLTNDNVIMMLQSGIPEDTVILAIQNSPTSFDTSPNALIDMMRRGASQRVLDAMLLAGTQSNTPDGAVNAPDEYPQGHGVYFVSDDGLQAMEPITSSGARAGNLLRMIGTAGLAGHGAFDVYPGPTSRLQLQTRQPVFVVRQDQITDRDLLIVRLSVRRRNREIQKTSDSVFDGSAQIGYRERDKVIVVVSRLASNVFEVTPAEPLASGEYMLIWPALDGALGVAPRGYDFTIQSMLTGPVGVLLQISCRRAE